MSSNNSLLVIGGSGFLGRAIVDMLLERGNQRVAVFDLKTDGNFDPRIQVYQGNILNEDHLLSAFNNSGTTRIIHTASPMPGAPAPSIFWKGLTMQLGDNTNLFDFLYVENAAYAVILAAEKLSGPVEENPVTGQVSIITNDDPPPFWDLARAV
ncbi:NAD(P)-binding protein [Heliocybe sulcata]|uniref:NAD(P)-binding protein n=1 Tax=Heliocybe sulcata TaxID=5364 RepID=A0A5C3MKX4_9AGAM|nr:NAD(P)-binding protein [Heliocybe sulcata]